MDGHETLLDLLAKQLADAGVAEEVAELVRAAYTGDDALAAVLAGTPLDGGAGTGGPGRRPAALYLESVAVAGFRGIGQAPPLRLHPGPGLTLVVGRNGSGKSSLAEAIELVLTGDSARWAGANAVFREGWRNLHRGTPCSIEMLVRPDGASEPIRITRTWDDAATDPAQADTAIRGDLDRGAWQGALDTYRPFLTANDVGRLVTSTPSGLFDALAPILGIEPVTDADKRLATARKAIDDRIGTIKAQLPGIRSALSDVDDDRARKAAELLSRRTVDLDALDALLADAATTVDPAVEATQRLAAVELPSVEEVRAAAAGLRSAARRVEAVAATQAGSAERAARVLEAALKWHDGQGDGPCPVCGAGTLDLAWHGRAYAEVTRLRDEAEAARDARRQLDAAGAGARMLVTVDRSLTSSTLDLAAGVSPQLLAALAGWRAVSPEAGPEEIAAHLETAYPVLRDAARAAQESATGWLRERHEAWRAHAASLQVWLTAKRESAADEALAARLKAARDFLKTAIDNLREARLAPFAAHSQRIWEELRQESNVELGGMKLAGSATRRKVAFPATVDGTATTAMAVMSQGELQALGLAVFLPRACAQESPFRFLVIDDPVQSMDPSKVDGLARVLHDLSATRQVVVFTHDNRLPEAVRRLDVPATSWEVVRQSQSVVTIRKNDDPVRRYLDDARALASTSSLDESVRWPVVAGFCRSALEAACHERIRHDRIGAGEAHAAVEELIDKAWTLTHVFALALVGEARRGERVLPMLNSDYGRWAGDVFRACQGGVHGDGQSALDALVNDAARLASAVRRPGGRP
jgi:predicted ATPase